MLRQRLGVDQESEALVEAELGFHLRVALLLLLLAGHLQEVEGLKLFQGLFGQHGIPFRGMRGGGSPSLSAIAASAAAVLVGWIGGASEALSLRMGTRSSPA